MNKKMILNYTPVLIYMGLIFYLSSIPLGFLEIFYFDPTKFTLHIAEYSILGFLLFRANNNKILSLFIGSVYGLGDEIHQNFVPFRVFSVFDIIADVIGVSVGIALFFLIKKFKR
jgi:VanZ family protein